jgi:quinol-cytochrome oxidoreductase complex cytochrome b subunit
MTKFILNIFSIREHLIKYPTPINFNYFWSFGSLAGVFLVIQLLTGIFLAMHYTPHVAHAFLSVEHIMRDVNYGWLIRYMHSNGASFFFIMVYAHMMRALYYSSYRYPYQNVWRLGVLIFVLMMATAFMGYVLPWGQMSFWGATVITNLFTAIPFVGESIAVWLWGGYSVDNATLNRFFSLHYLLPFLIIGVVFLHLLVLHTVGSGQPLQVNDTTEFIPFYPYYFYKDLVSFFCVMFIYMYFVGYLPNYLGHPDNYIEANPLSTPSHIVPEWYFLPFYAILRSIPNKLGGVLCMFGAIIILFFLPNLRNIGSFSKLITQEHIWLFENEIISPQFSPYKQFCFWMFFFNTLILGWLGAQPVEYPYIQIGMCATFYYFFHFFFVIPGLTFLEIYALASLKKK